MLRYLKALMIVFFMAFGTISYADEIHDLVKVQTYIKSKCNKGCVDPGVLLDGLRLVKRELGVDPILMMAIIRQESAFKTMAKNGGSVGLTQVLLRYHKGKFKSTNVYGPMDNIRVGGMVLRDCVKKHPKDRRQSARCYNGYQLGDPGYYPKIQKHLREITSLGLLTLS